MKTVINFCSQLHMFKVLPSFKVGLVYMLIGTRHDMSLNNIVGNQTLATHRYLANV